MNDIIKDTTIQKIKDFYYKKSDEYIKKNIKWRYGIGVVSTVEVMLNDIITLNIRKIGFLPTYKNLCFPFANRTLIYMYYKGYFEGDLVVCGDKELNEIVDSLYKLSLVYRDEDIENETKKNQEIILRDLNK